MKKLLTLSVFLLVSTAIFSQGLFHKVNPDIFKNTNKNLGLTSETIKGSWQWCLDGTINVALFMWNKDTKNLDAQPPIIGIGPAIGYQHFVPRSITDPTPVNNYGISAAAILTKPFFFGLQANIWQYFKFGLAYIPNPPTNDTHFGIFFGGGITFNDPQH